MLAIIRILRSLAWKGMKAKRPSASMATVEPPTTRLVSKAARTLTERLDTRWGATARAEEVWTRVARAIVAVGGYKVRGDCGVCSEGGTGGGMAPLIRFRRGVFPLTTLHVLREGWARGWRLCMPSVGNGVMCPLPLLLVLLLLPAGAGAALVLLPCATAIAAALHAIGVGT